MNKDMKQQTPSIWSQQFPPPDIRSSCIRMGGFSLLELMAVLLVLSALAFSLFFKTQTLSNQQHALDVTHQMPFTANALYHHQHRGAHQLLCRNRCATSRRGG